MRLPSFVLPTLLLAAALPIAACDVTPPPERQSAEAQKAREHHELRDTIQQPIDKAKGVEQIQQQGDEERRKQMEAEGG
jgi:hypothetical protein